MMRSLLLLSMVAICLAGTVVEHRQHSSSIQSKPDPIRRDGASRHSDSFRHGSRSEGTSSYSGPSPHSSSGSSDSYKGGSSGGDSGDQAGLYFYYYPVEEQNEYAAADAGFDVFTAIILPLIILGGLLLALSSFTFNFTSGRSLGDAVTGENSNNGMVDQLQMEVERIFYLYLNAFESEACIQRAVCESGLYAKNYKHKEFFMSMVDPFIPETMKGNVAIFKMAAKDGFDTGKCKKYSCSAPKIFS